MIPQQWDPQNLGVDGGMVGRMGARQTVDSTATRMVAQTDGRTTSGRTVGHAYSRMCGQKDGQTDGTNALAVGLTDGWVDNQISDERFDLFCACRLFSESTNWANMLH